MKYKLKFTKNELRDGCAFSTIAHAISNLEAPLFVHEQTWDEVSYHFQHESSRGTITFDKKQGFISAAVRNDYSKKILNYPACKAIDLFQYAPEAVKRLASAETLAFLYYDIDGEAIPVASSAFWSEGNDIYSSDEYDAFIEQGGEFLGIVCQPLHELLLYWEDHYDFTAEEIESVKYICNLYASGIRQITVEDLPLSNITESKGYPEFKQTLSEMGIEVIS